VEKGAILLMGLPGVGKGTQAFNLIGSFPNFVHVDTGAEIYRRIHDPTFASDPTVQKQREIYEAGLLNDPRWVANLVVERIHTYASQGKGVIFSGSPRTLYEAETIAPLLFEVYGRDRVLVLTLSTAEETARRRAFNRLTCPRRECRYPTTRDHAGERCPHCGEILAADQESEAWKATKIDERFREFRQRTLPALDYLASLGLVEIIDAEGTREEVSTMVLEAIKRRLL